MKKPRDMSSNGPAIRRVFGSTEHMNIPIPVVTNDDNQYKVGVDVADQYRSYYFTQLKCLRNWLPIFFWLLDMTVINAYLLSQRVSASYRLPTSPRLFRIRIAQWIISTYGPKQLKPRKSFISDSASSSRKQHFPTHLVVYRNISLFILEED